MRILVDVVADIPRSRHSLQLSGESLLSIISTLQAGSDGSNLLHLVHRRVKLVIFFVIVVITI